MRNLGYFERQITSDYTIDDIGLDLESIGLKTYERITPVASPSLLYMQEEELLSSMNQVYAFLETQVPLTYHNRPIWFRTNVIDQAHNDYIGIGFLNIESPWLKFVLSALCTDLADQSGDTLLTIFDCNFRWAINFELSQDDKCLTVQIFEKIES